MTDLDAPTASIAYEAAMGARFAMLVEESSDFLRISDLDGRTQFLNKAGRAMVGFGSLEDSLGCKLLDLLFPGQEESERKAFRELQARGVWKGEMLFRHAPSGRAVPALVSRFVLRDPATGTAEGYATLAQDLTALREKEERLRQAEKLESLGRLAGGVAHDFNNLLTAIIGYAQLLVSVLPESDPHRSLAVEITRAGDRAASLTRQLLAYSRKQVQQKAPLSLNSLVRDMEPMLRTLLGPGIVLESELRPEAGYAMLDRSQAEQIVMNLAVNARDAMPDGGVLRIRTRDGAGTGALAKGAVIFEVSDTGVGMDAEVKAHIFEPFFTSKESGKGTGLGLATVHGIVEQSEGSISVESAPGHGATFRILFPRALAPRAEETHAARSEGRAGSRGGRILLAEDEPMVRQYLKTILVSGGYTVTEAGDGEEAWACFQAEAHRFDVLVTDVIMPRMGGLDLARRVRDTLPMLPVLFLSGYVAEARIAEALSQPGTEFLSKPVTHFDLLERLRALVAEPQARGAEV